MNKRSDHLRGVSRLNSLAGRSSLWPDCPQPSPRSLLSILRVRPPCPAWRNIHVGAQDGQLGGMCASTLPSLSDNTTLLPARCSHHRCRSAGWTAGWRTPRKTRRRCSRAGSAAPQPHPASSRRAAGGREGGREGEACRVACSTIWQDCRQRVAQEWEAGQRSAPQGRGGGIVPAAVAAAAAGATHEQQQAAAGYCSSRAGRTKQLSLSLRHALSAP